MVYVQAVSKSAYQGLARLRNNEDHRESSVSSAAGTLHRRMGCLGSREHPVSASPRDRLCEPSLSGPTAAGCPVRAP